MAIQTGQDLAWHVSIGDCFVLVPTACSTMHRLPASGAATGTASGAGFDSVLLQQQQQQQARRLSGGGCSGSGDICSCATDAGRIAHFPWRLRQVATVEVVPGADPANATLVLVDNKQVSAGAVFSGRLFGVSLEVSRNLPLLWTVFDEPCGLPLGC